MRDDGEPREERDRPDYKWELARKKPFFALHSSDEGGEAEHAEDIVDIGSDEVPEREAREAASRSRCRGRKLRQARAKRDDREANHELAHAVCARKRARAEDEEVCAAKKNGEA